MDLLINPWCRIKAVLVSLGHIKVSFKRTLSRADDVGENFVYGRGSMKRESSRRFRAHLQGGV